MTGAADVGLTALLDALKGPFGPLVVVLALGRADQFAELVIETLIAKIALLLSDPLLKPEMWFDDKLAHENPPRPA